MRMEIRAVYGVYLLETRQIWAPRSRTALRTGLADPPRQQADFDELGNAVLRSDRICITSQSGLIALPELSQVELCGTFGDLESFLRDITSGDDL